MDALQPLVEEITDRILRNIVAPLALELDRAIAEARRPFAYRENKETAALLGMSLGSLKKKRANNEINFRKDGEIITYTVEDIEEYLERIAQHRAMPPVPGGKVLKLVGSGGGEIKN